MQLGNIDNSYCNYVNNTKFHTPFISHFHVRTEGEGWKVSKGWAECLAVCLPGRAT